MLTDRTQSIVISSHAPSNANFSEDIVLCIHSTKLCISALRCGAGTRMPFIKYSNVLTTRKLNEKNLLRILHSTSHPIVLLLPAKLFRRQSSPVGVCVHRFYSVGFLINCFNHLIYIIFRKTLSAAFAWNEM